jgi:N-acetylmuramoyl-L-alanine amidase
MSDNTQDILVAIDAGHASFGVTPGKRSPDNEYEWDFNNKVALACIARLEANGIKIFRLDDPTGKTDVPLKVRTDKANKVKANILVSIHHNANTGKWGTWTGTETYIYTNASANSEKLAKIVQPLLVKAYGLSDRGVKRKNLHMVRESFMPAILTEGGFFDSSIDIKKLRDDKVLKNAGEVIANGIMEYFGIQPKEDVWYRVRKSFEDSKSQIGAFKNLDSAKKLVDQNKGYFVFDEKGQKIYPEPPKQEQWYRVRLNWSDSKSQKGAFKNLDGAKKCADENKGYKVFDESGKVVYEPKAEAPKSKPIQTQPTPQPEDKCEYHNDIMGKSVATKEQMIYLIEKAIEDGKIPSNNVPKDIARDFYDVGEAEGVRGDVALAQALKETGYFKYGGDVKPEQNNFCGLGATGGGVHGHSFKTSLEGIQAQIQHLKGYATSEPLKTPLVDPRYKYINPKGRAPHVEDLAGKWAVPGYERSMYSSLEEAMKANDGYGHQIMKIVEQMVTIEVPVVEEESIIEKPKKEDVPSPNPQPEPIKVVEDEKPTEQSTEISKEEKLVNLFTLFIEFLYLLFGKKK